MQGSTGRIEVIGQARPGRAGTALRRIAAAGVLAALAPVASPAQVAEAPIADAEAPIAVGEAAASAFLAAQPRSDRWLSAPSAAAEADRGEADADAAVEVAVVPEPKVAEPFRSPEPPIRPAYQAMLFSLKAVVASALQAEADAKALAAAEAERTAAEQDAVLVAETETAAEPAADRPRDIIVASAGEGAWAGTAAAAAEEEDVLVAAAGPATAPVTVDAGQPFGIGARPAPSKAGTAPAGTRETVGDDAATAPATDGSEEAAVAATGSPAAPAERDAGLDGLTELDRLSVAVPFLSGEQAVTNDHRRAKIAGRAYRLRKLLEDPERRADVIVSIRFVGSADGVGGEDKTVVAYRGDLGPEIAIEHPVVVDATPVPARNFRAGTPLTNPELALVRASAMAAVFDEFIGPHDVLVETDRRTLAAETHAETGRAFRYGRIEVRVLEAASDPRV